VCLDQLKSPPPPHPAPVAGETPWFGLLASRVGDFSWWVAEAAAKAVTEAPNLAPATAAAVRREIGRVEQGGETSRARELAAEALRGARWEARRNELRGGWMLQPVALINAELRRRGLRSLLSEEGEGGGPSSSEGQEDMVRWNLHRPFVDYNLARAVDAIVDDEIRGGGREKAAGTGQRGQAA
jgi:hypothetical protein